MGVLFLLSTAAFASTDAHVENAYRNSRGELLVMLSGNQVYWGNPAELHRLELQGHATSTEDTTLSFYRGMGSGKERSGEIEVDSSGARVQCDAHDGTEGFAPVAASERREIESAIQSGKTKLSGLPGVLEPLYLFDSGKDLVLVMGPVFDFHGNFSVLMGARNHLKPVAVDHAPERASDSEQGRIRFAKGGGLFIPLTIDLMGREGNRGSPALIRAEGASIEPLTMPHLPRAEIERLGFGKAIRAPLFNPCDRGRTVQVGPRSL